MKKGQIKEIPWLPIHLIYSITMLGYGGKLHIYLVGEVASVCFSKDKRSFISHHTFLHYDLLSYVLFYRTILYRKRIIKIYDYLQIYIERSTDLFFTCFRGLEVQSSDKFLRVSM